MAEWLAKPYQGAGASWLLAKPFSGLLMPPGLGKTSVVLAVRSILQKKKLSKRALVIAPFSVADMVWAEENEKWGFGLKVGFAHGACFEKTIKDKSYDLVTMTPDGVARLQQSFTPRDIAKLFDHLIIDESTKFKKTQAKRFKILKTYLNSFGRRTILTGTPAPNGYLNLFCQTYLVDCGHRLGRYITRYILEYFNSVGFGGYTKVLKKGAAKQIQQKLADILFFVDDEVLGLEKLRLNPIKVQLPKKVMRLYHDLIEEMIVDVNRPIASIKAVNAAVLSNKLRMVANGAVYGYKHNDLKDRDDKKTIHLHEAKLEALVDLVEQLQGNPLLVAYEYDCDRERIIQALGKNILVIKGGMGKKQRREILTAFNTGDHPVLLAQSATVAHGLNLQKSCHTICWYTLPWDLEVWIQFNKRVHRMGQKKQVMVHALLAAGTIDEEVFQVLKSKHKVQRGLLEALVQHIKGDKRASHDKNTLLRRRRVSRKVPPAKGKRQLRRQGATAHGRPDLPIPARVPKRGAARVRDSTPQRRPSRGR